MKGKLKHLVGVYGTLRKGMSNHHYLKDAELIVGMRAGGYEMRSLGKFPAVMYAPMDSLISVEVYHVSDATLKQLDELEGVPTFYKRRKLGSADLGKGEQDIYIYVVEDELYRDEDKYPVIENGDWVDYQRNQEKADA